MALTAVSVHQVQLCRKDKTQCEEKTYLAFHKVANSCLGHDRYCDRLHDLLDHLGITHARHATLCSNVCGNTLESHDRGCAGLFCYACLRSLSERLEPFCKFFHRSLLRERGHRERKPALRTCSAFTTSIMTPPFNILANPALTAKLFSPSWAVWPLDVGSSVGISSSN